VKEKKAQSKSTTSKYSRTTFVNLDNDELDEKLLKKQEPIDPVVGWLVIVGGYGMGKSFELKRGLNEIGQDKVNKISIDFGDNSINSIRHLIVIFDHTKGSFLIQSGSNDSDIVLNGKKMYYFDELKSGDTIQVGSTTMRFVSFCTESCTWDFDKLL
jgi:hypothetical protein